MLKIAICDDQRVDLCISEFFIKEYLQSRNIKGEIRKFEHPDTLIEECEKFRPHIYLLDIVMPMVSGIEAARELRSFQPDAQIIFATSESSYALESFDVNPVSYIVKPIDKDKLFETLDVAVRRLAIEDDKTITVKVKGGYVTLNTEDIMYIDYRNHVVSYHMFDGKQISTATLRIGFGEYLEMNHAGDDFVKCHESVSVYIPAIDRLTKTDITVRNKEVIPVSKSRYQKVAQRFMDYRLH